MDRFPPGHDRGSSHGRTRIIRQAYFEHPDYVPLLLRAYELWAELSQRCGKQLYHEIGLLQIGPPNGSVVPGVLQAAQLHGLRVDHLSASQAEKRFPGFRISSKWEAVFEQKAGYLDVEKCVLAHVEEAKKLGAEIRSNVEANSWKIHGNRCFVSTSHGDLATHKLVIAAGPWAPQLLADLGIILEVRRKDVYWYPIDDQCLRADHGCPAFLYELDEKHALGIWYGIPEVDEFGFKIAEHTDALPRVVSDPLSIRRETSRIGKKNDRIISFHVDALGGSANVASRHLFLHDVSR